MSKDRHEQVGALFLEARELPPDKRASFLDEACADDAALRAEVESLLEAEAGAPSLEYPLPRTPATQTTPTDRTAGVGGGTQRFVPGIVLARRYRMVNVIGRGGMGEVFRADDLKLGQPVALKFLPPGLERDANLRNRFLNEAKVALKVTHPNVCRVYDLGEVDGQHFISMEYIDGENLASLLLRVGRLPNNKALQIAGEICAGLSAAHEQRILHRDLKPSNIMLDGRGRVKITDFGLAGLEEAIQDADLTSGTPAYMSPEQLAGQEVTTRSDIYALGLVLYELFTGQPAFSGKTYEELAAKHRDAAPEPPSNIVQGLDPVVEQVIQRCLQKKPQDRPDSALAVAGALPGADPLEAALAAGETPSAEMVAAAGVKGHLRLRVALGLLAGLVLSLIVAVVIADRVWLTARVPLPKSPQSLADEAADILNELGYTESGSVAFGFRPDYSYIYRLAPGDDRPARWDRLKRDRPPAMLFWYRHSPGMLKQQDQTWPVSATNPSPLSPGMINLVLDPQGRLVAFTSVPRPFEKVNASADVPISDTWKTMFAAAGLEMGNFAEETELKWQPPVASDHRRAWTGTAEQARPKIHVAAAALRGKPTAFRVMPPRWIPDRPATPRKRPGAVMIFRLIIFLMTLCAAVPLAAFQLRRGRGDRRGALRVGIFIFVSLTVIWFCFVFRLPLDAWGLVWACQRNIGFAAFIALTYFAAEPFVRRRSPKLMVSWSRVLAGRWRDPLVGCDILIGIAVGVAVPVSMRAIDLLGRFVLDKPEPFPAFFPFIIFDLRQALGHVISNAFDAVNAVTSMLVIPLLLAVVLRKRWLAIAALWLLASFFTHAQQPVHSVWTFAIAGIEVGAILVVLFRFGLLAGVAAFFATNTILDLNGTTDLFAWNGRPALIGYSVLVLLALIGFFTSVGGRHSFSDRRLMRGAR